ncbi:tetratricopeptide repeat protein [Hyalangium versicolor]|uniref:tetratricopeptide repeat protein n=1 Tax=Hyalangium versicolor TaxID=2861190 RepID=UPI001CCC6F88|nr:tetratricopeptide repeat protein [Hyalangium versicolor]
MSRLKLGSVIMVLLAALTGCKEKQESAAPTAQAAPATKEARDDNRLLALASPGGQTAVDQQIRQLQEQVLRSPEKVEMWLALGQEWIRKARGTGDPGYYLNAGACAEVALKLSPDQQLALSLKGMVLLNAHRFADARTFAETALKQDADDALALGVLSDANLELGDFEGAAAAAQRMMDLKPNLPAYGRAAHLRWLQGDAAAAKQFYRMAIDAGGDSRDAEPLAWMIVQTAMLFWHEGDVEGAEAGFDTALGKLEGYPPALMGKARVALARGEARRAVELLERAQAQSPLAETAWLLGDAREAAGDVQGAQAAYAEVTRLGKQGDHLTLALFLATKDREPGEALRLAQAEHGARPNVYVEDAYSWALYRAGKLTEARSASDRARALGTKDPRLQFHAGAIRLAQGETAEGLALLKQALSLNPEFDVSGANEARKLLAAPPSRHAAVTEARKE